MLLDVLDEALNAWNPHVMTFQVNQGILFELCERARHYFPNRADSRGDLLFRQSQVELCAFLRPCPDTSRFTKKPDFPLCNKSFSQSYSGNDL